MSSCNLNPSNVFRTQSNIYDAAIFVRKAPSDMFTGFQLRLLTLDAIGEKKGRDSIISFVCSHGWGIIYRLQALTRKHQTTTVMVTSVNITN